VIIGVGHLDGRCVGGDRAGCAELSGEIKTLLDAFEPGTFAAFVLGHSHALVSTVYRGTAVIESYAEGGAIGRAEIRFDPTTGRSEVVKVGPTYALCRAADEHGACGRDTPSGALAATLTADASVTELLARCRDLPCPPLGDVSAELTRDRWGASPLGTAMADLLRAGTPGVDFAIINAGGLRIDVPAGPLDECGLYRVLPFDNAVAIVQLTGAEIELFLRLGSNGSHGVLQTSGLRYRYEPCKAWTPADDLDGDATFDDFERNRLAWVTTESGKKLAAKKIYKVATSDFLLLGGDGLGPLFEKIPSARVRVDYDSKIRDAVMRGLKKRKGKLGPPAGKPRIEVGAGEPDPGKWGAEGCK
jgi:2',3'-cyclic-nucleotide 2'-phosphodiesterase (5'-nucleotidase family)